MTMKARTTRQSGMMLIEVMITIIIVSFGLLGVAGVILNSLKANESSYGRAQAVWLANDIIDRMRANRVAAEAAALPYNVALGATPTSSGVPGDDLSAWVAAVASTLPAGKGSVSVVAATKKVTVTVQWDDSRAAAGSSTEKFIVETRL
jgi:type IV pilus assembly protein PilV